MTHERSALFADRFVNDSVHTRVECRRPSARPGTGRACEGAATTSDCVKVEVLNLASGVQVMVEILGKLIAVP